MEPGINKPFDRIAKELAEEAPRVFVHLLGLVPPGSKVDLQPLRPESAPPVVMPDYVSMMRIDGGDPCLFHVEFFVRFRHEIPGKMARYGGSLAWQYRLPVKSVVVLLSDGGCPETVPEIGVQHIGKTVLTHPYSTVKLWELDPEHVLAAEDPGLWPWALLMRLDREGARAIGAKIAETGDERWIARFLSLGSLRYDRTEVEEMLGGVAMGLGEAMIEAIEERAEARGKAEGKAEEARRILKMALARLFPGLENHPDLDRIEDAQVLESLLLENVFQADDCDVVHRAITAAVRG